MEEAPVEEEPVAEEEPFEEETVPEDDEVEVLEPEEEEYDAIVLVPAEDNPPVNEEPEDEVFEDEANPLIPLNPEFNSSITNTDVETEVETEIETETSAQIVQPVSSGNETDYAKFMVDGLDQLEADKYYIQIATLKDDANILEIVNKYGKKYPITIVPTAKGTKQVLVGPVTMDEYGTVLARFKSYGYKDAFLRKGTNPNPKPRVQADEK